MALTNEELSVLARSLRHSTEPQIRKWADFPAGRTVPEIDTTYRRAAVGNVRVPRRRRTTGWRGARAVTAALLLAACTGAAAVAWQSDVGTLEPLIARWAPQHVLTSLLRLGKPALPAQPSAPNVDAIAASPEPPQSGSPARNTPDGVAADAVTSPVESASSPGSSDIAVARQEIEELKASIEELKANQRQMSLDIAKASEVRSSEVGASEQNLRPKISAHPLRTAAPRVPKPRPPLPPLQAAADPSTPRPPMPLR